MAPGSRGATPSALRSSVRLGTVRRSVPLVPPPSRSKRSRQEPSKDGVGGMIERERLPPITSGGVFVAFTWCGASPQRGSDEKLDMGCCMVAL
jgi:hypothetical protein